MQTFWLQIKRLTSSLSNIDRILMTQYSWTLTPMQMNHLSDGGNATQA